MKRALLSVTDKTGLVELAQALAAAGVALISTGGTAKLLRTSGLDVQEIADYTGFPEMLSGRVKTLHPKVHGGLLYLRDDADHQQQAAAHGIEPIDYVVVNLYAFEDTIRKPGVTLEDAIENIDIGGPGMLRSASKNYRSVTVLSDPADYPAVIEQLKANGETTPALRAKLAAKVFRTTSYYDGLIAKYLAETIEAEEAAAKAAEPAPEAESASPFPDFFTLPLKKAQSLRYGENPHQKAALFGDFPQHFRQLHGKELSYNNLIDISAAVNLMDEFTEKPTVAILKHTNPCGVGAAASLREAWDNAYATDRQAPFGGIIIANKPVDLPTAEAIAEIFSEVIIAPGFEPEAQMLLQKKKMLRLIQDLRTAPGAAAVRYEVKPCVGNSWLVQTSDPLLGNISYTVATQRQPTAEELDALLFSWRVVKHVKSNAIVYGKAGRTIGIGAGQMARVDSSKIAIWKAGEAGLDLKGSVVASDAFFPFPDGLIAAADAGATAAIQPGGSKKDPEVIAAANDRGMAMLFTGKRHFRH
ncbi:bifunctional phosphoribosylaminoimidazolecarboxamide formyltransferase/inosine monophosphate cyclohydrolase [Verrucomicrobia bacterium LW23]|nr:bifunctional phosphoribosylaminoimidazolecarboxamide formyltransferase/inosine monophosphate cyclohydrolase [Verrucomicrobia bacterium LW23]